MHIFTNIMDFIIHIDKHLIVIMESMGMWTYLILFLIIFIETGLVIFPFLPGDSLLFAASALAAVPGSFLQIQWLILIFILAAIIGDSVNYEIGKHVGLSISSTSLIGKFINQEKMAKSQHFFEQHGKKTIFIARFMPFIRTFAPFIAGASKMPYRYFIRYNITGGVTWVLLCCLSGYFFGNIPVVKNNFSLAVIGVILVSMLPVLFHFIQNKLNKKREAK